MIKLCKELLLRKTKKLFIQPHIIQSKFSHTLHFNIIGITSWENNSIVLFS